MDISLNSTALVAEKAGNAANMTPANCSDVGRCDATKLLRKQEITIYSKLTGSSNCGSHGRTTMRIV
eukprot:scaffold378_cov270-Chaetoceros_neogracile.AAC.15